MSHVDADSRDVARMQVEQDTLFRAFQSEGFALAGQEPLQVERLGQEGIGDAQVEIVHQQPDRVGLRGADDAVRQQVLLAVADGKIINPDVFLAVTDRGWGKFPGVPGDGQVGWQQVDADQVGVGLWIGEGNPGAEMGAGVRPVIIVESELQVDDGIGQGVDVNMFSHQAARLQAVDVDIGADMVVERQAAKLDVLQEELVEGRQFR